MNILFLAPLAPYPPVDGDRQRALRLLQALSRKHRVYLLCFARGRAERAGLEHLAEVCAGVASVPISERGIRWHSLTGLWGNQPLNVAAFRSTAMFRAVRRWTARERFDAVHAYRLRMAPYALASGIRPRVLDFTDSLTLYFQARQDWRQPFWKHWYMRREARQLAAWEGAMARAFDLTLVSAPRDRDLIKSLGAGPPPVVVSNGVDTRKLKPAARLERRPRLLFVGNQQYLPNAAGLEWFCRECWPSLRAQVPEARLTVVGGSPRRRALPGIEWTGVVCDVLPYYHEARAVICPLPASAGRQFKALEAFAAGVPVVAFPQVADNLGARTGRHLLTAERPADFVRQAVRLCRDDRLAAALRRQALAFVRARFDWRSAEAELLSAYGRLARAARGRESC